MDAVDLLSDILANNVKMEIAKGLMDEYTDYSEEEKDSIVKGVVTKFNDKLERRIKELSNGDIHKSADGDSLRSLSIPPPPFLEN